MFVLHLVSLELGLDFIKTVLVHTHTITQRPSAIVLVVTHFFSRENLLKRILGSQLALPDHVWVTLSFGWAVAFFIQGTLNLIVAYNFSLDFWVTYKLVGGIGLTLIYIIITMTYLVRGGYLNDDDTATQSDTVAPDSETAESITHKPKPGTE